VTAYGATDARTPIVQRMLHETGREDIPVIAGIKTNDARAPQFLWGQELRNRKPSRQDAVAYYSEQLNRFPGEITIIPIGPLTNLGALIERDPDAFRKAKRVVMMGGNARLAFYDSDQSRNGDPMPEYNIMKDIPAAQKVFSSGVPIVMLGLDCTMMLKLDEVKRERIFRRATPLTDALTVLYHLWGNQTPTLFDPMAVATALDPSFVRLVPMHIDVDEKGVTREVPGKPANAQVGFDPQQDKFFTFVIDRLRAQDLHGTD
jgi:purine nucleosidase